jgi:hypothetical protein
MTIATGQPMLASDINDLTFFPKGTILIFSSEAYSATSAEFKKIWKICNGQDGTPDLVDKFLRGGESSNFTTPGGADSQSITLSTNNLPSHNHSIYDPGHRHSFSAPDHSSGAGYSGEQASTPGNPLYTNSVKTGISVNNTGSNQPFTVNTVPAYYTVIYIIKIA